MHPRIANAFTFVDEIVGTLLRQDDPGVALSIDVGGSFLDLIAANAAENAGCTSVRSPSLLRQRAVSNRSRRHASVSAVVAEPTVFGRIDGSLHMFDAGDPLESYGCWHEPFATRSIDSWMSGRPPLRLAHFGDPELLDDQLAGAAATISRDRPILTFYTAHRDTTALLSLMESLEYRCFDLAAQPPVPAELRPLTSFGWIAVPKDKEAAVHDIGARLPIESETNGVWGEGLKADCAVFPRQRRSSAVFGLSANALVDENKLIEAEEIIGLTDVYPPEMDGEHSWRWLGPKPRSRLAVPCPAPGSYRIELCVVASHLESGLAGSRVIVDGREVRATKPGSLPGTIAFVGRREAFDYAGYMEIDVVSTGRSHPPAGEHRTLRLCVQDIGVSQWN